MKNAIFALSFLLLTSVLHAYTAKVAVQVSVMGMSQKSTSWFHPAVPINGSVKGASDDGKWTVELLDFGTSGASSKF